MRYSREVALTFDSRVEEDLNVVTQRIKAVIAKEFSNLNIKVRITRNGFHPDNQEEK